MKKIKKVKKMKKMKEMKKRCRGSDDVPEGLRPGVQIICLDNSSDLSLREQIRLRAPERREGGGSMDIDRPHYFRSIERFAING
ncbi:hypothetical protein F2P81_025342 [Scophthalmus maximus]|uniref:Uncharacterized protein n=1 Tax=Scophthalmus maximus TaxID=52904 RepID=A0A6A4RT68_SCOMX|nr:hypothetical protein F2P81_025342 [Scophthalmus maximus]